MDSNQKRLSLDIFYRCLAVIWRIHKYQYHCTSEKVAHFRASLEANCDQEKKKFEKAIPQSVALKELGPIVRSEHSADPRRLIDQIYTAAKEFFKKRNREIVSAK